MNAASLQGMLEDFLAGAAGAVVLDQGGVLFDLSTSRYSVSDEHGRVLLHLWSEERNLVRRVLEAESKGELLKLTVMRFGQPRPATLEIWRTRDRRSDSAKRSARGRYQQLLQRVLAREFPASRLEQLSSAMDLERSFSPVYARGLLRRGRSGFAVLGVNQQEPQAAVDGALTFALLWFDHLRTRCAPELHVEGLRLFAPAGCSAVLRERMAHLDAEVAKWELYELMESGGEVRSVDCRDRGNIITRLVQCPEAVATRERFAACIARVCGELPECEVAVLTSSEVAFRYRGLEFARARLAGGNGLSLREEIVFGIGAAETVLDERNQAPFRALLQRLQRARTPSGSRADALWRLAPERWLESLVQSDVGMIDPRLDGSCVYSQVPAFSASDRAVIDVLARTREGRLAVLELKADEDIHLPLQGVDYWARVCWHQQREEFRSYGYFPGKPLADEAPILFLVAPALHIHPATDTLLRYLSPEIECEVVAVHERWREEPRVVFRKRRTQKQLSALVMG